MFHKLCVCVHMYMGLQVRPGVAGGRSSVCCVYGTLLWHFSLTGVLKKNKSGILCVSMSPAFSLEMMRRTSGVTGQ